MGSSQYAVGNNAGRPIHPSTTSPLEKLAFFLENYRGHPSRGEQVRKAEGSDGSTRHAAQGWTAATGKEERRGTRNNRRRTRRGRRRD